MPAKRGGGRLGSGLAGFLLEPFASDANALLLIGIGRAQPTQVCCDLADLPLVCARHGQMGLLVDRDLNAFGDRKLNRMRKPQRDDEVASLHLGPITHTDNVEFLLKPSRDAGHRIGDERPR